MKRDAARSMIEKLEQELTLACGRYDPNSEVIPACLIWTDADGQWRDAVELLKPRLPQLYEFGEYDPDKRRGPAIWLKCVIAGSAGIEAHPHVTPIIYLPGVSRQELRGAADCRREYQPLIELQYRGLVWCQRNGKDWTLEAFLVSSDGLGLDIARDEQTRLAFRGAVSALLTTPVEELKGGRLTAADFDRLVEKDPARSMLQWINDPKIGKEVWSETHWHAFVSSSKREFDGFDPVKLSNLDAAERLGRRDTPGWQALWRRFSEAPERYPHIPDLLTKVKPPAQIDLLGRTAGSWPDDNRVEEDKLRDALLKLRGVDAPTARAKVAELEEVHAKRRDWVWAKLGQSDLACALKDLASLVQSTSSSLGGCSLHEMGELYALGGYQADLQARRALAKVKKSSDFRAVETAVRALYLPWLVSGAELFQRLAAEEDFGPFLSRGGSVAEPGELIVFIDGLRFDLAAELQGFLDEQGLRTKLTWRFSACPSLTATAKPAMSPIAEYLDGGREIPDDLSPNVSESGVRLNRDKFIKLLTENKYLLDVDSEVDPSSIGWTEIGSVDEKGHNSNDDFPRELRHEIERIVEQISQFLDAGWSKVRLITDHGWLFLAGGLPAIKVPSYLVTARGHRCAVIKGESKVDVPTARWTWNPMLSVAVAPSVSAFREGLSYAHGGLTAQECVIPVLDVERLTKKSSQSIKIKEVQWIKLRCRVTISPKMEGISVDIREKPNDSNTTVVTSIKETDSEGLASLLAKNEEFESKAAVVVLLDSSGSVIAKFPTIIGGE